MRRPYRQRFAIILNEFGTGLAARGKDLRDVIRGANPALRQFDRFLKILADQNKMLRDLAQNGDKVLSALGAQAPGTSPTSSCSRASPREATAEKRRDLERNFEKFPPFLRQLRPFMLRFAALSSQMLPVVSDLRAAGPDISRFLIALGPFSTASTPALKSLGNTADVARPGARGGEADRQPARRIRAQAQPSRRTWRTLLVEPRPAQGDPAPDGCAS